MAYYTALINAWNSAQQPPAGVTGTALTGLTTANKLIAINGWTVAAAAAKALFTPSQILNAIVPADLNALSQLQVGQLTLLLQGSTVDASVGTTIRLGIQTLFAGKTTTLSQLAALVAPYDNATQLWWVSNGYSSPISQNDLVAAGGLS